MGQRKMKCVVAGAGMIGLSCGIELINRGFEVCLIDPDSPGSRTSAGNAGGFGVTEIMPMAVPGIIGKMPRWLFDPDGPLSVRWRQLPVLFPWLWRFYRMSSAVQTQRIARVLASLLQQCTEDSRQLIGQAGLQHLLRGEGAMTVYQSKAAFEGDRLEWEMKQRHGIRIERLDARKVCELEPALSGVCGGWLMPQWFNTVDPYQLAAGLADRFRQSGGTIRRDAVQRFAITGKTVAAVKTSQLQNIEADMVVIAAGVWSKALCRQLGERVLMESERGYNATLSDPGIRLKRQIIFGEEKFVATNIGDRIRIGGAAEFAGLHARPRYDRCGRLVNIAKRYLPGLNSEQAENWMGHRPSTPDSLPVICRSGHYHNVYYAFGHGHLGLTMAATTAKLIGQLMSGAQPAMALEALHINRFS